MSFLIYIISILPFILTSPKSGITFLDFLSNRYIYKDLKKTNCFHLNNHATYAITGLSTAKAYFISKNYGGFLDFRKSHSICLKKEEINCIPKQCLVLN
jgi:hypothetical protein